MNNTDLSIIIVNWNTKDFLINCLKSIQRDNSCNLEIIIVDNNSSDGSVEILEKQYGHIKLIRNSSNLGFAKANNIGINASMGRFIALINSDIIVHKNCLNTLIRFMDNNPEIGAAGPRILNPDRTVQISARKSPGIWNNLCQVLGLNKLFPKSSFFSDWFMTYWQHDSVRKVDALSGCFIIVRKEAVRETGVLDEKFFFYGEDLDWCKRFRDKGWDIALCPDAQATHFGAASSSKTPISCYLQLQKADLYYWEKHHGRVGGLIYRLTAILRQVTRIIFNLIRLGCPPEQRADIIFRLKRHWSSLKWLIIPRKYQIK